MNNKKVVFTLHAEDKLKRLMKIGVTKEKRKRLKICFSHMGRQDAYVIR